MGSVSLLAELRSDPARLLQSAAGEHGLELALLESLRAFPVPPDAKSLVWNALEAQVIGAGLAGAASSSSWASAFWRGTLKVLAASKTAVAVPVVIAALGAGALHYQHRSGESSRGPEATAPAQAPETKAPSLADTSSLETDGDSLALEREEAPSRAATPAPVKDPLRQESVLLERARAQLRSGRARAAQATLLRLQAQFPKGALTQEREVLLIEALAARGNSEAAARDARSFVAAHPESPHAVQLRRFIDHSERDARSN